VIYLLAQLTLVEKKQFNVRERVIVEFLEPKPEIVPLKMK
jgi:hypothetical protein